MTHRHHTLSTAALIVAMFFVSSADGATLVAHYEFEDASDLGRDSSGMENHADDVIDVEQVSGQFGQAAFFDEALGSSFVKYDGLNGFTGKPGVTLAAWVKLDEFTTGYDGIISQDAGGCCDNRILLHPNQQPFINLSEHDDRHLTAAPFFEFDDWMHIAMTGMDDPDGGFAEARVYVNGEEVEDSPQEFPEMDDGSAWNLYLGAGEAGNVHLLTGALDDVRVYEGALTEDEILLLLVDDGGGLKGDFNGNGGLDVGDIDDLTEQSSGMQHPVAYDLNADSLVDAQDVNLWIKDLYNSWVGDANLDGEFNSGDLVAVLASGKYEDDSDSVWSTGDFDGSGRSNSSDLVAALSDGGYEAGPRQAIAAAVPEPTALVLVVVGLLSLRLRRR